jgi:hypothetical protein
VAPGARCGDTILELREAASWHWQGEALVILGAKGRALLLFQPVGPNHWRAERASAPTIDLYLMIPEAMPSQT